MWFIMSWKEAGAFVSPNGITRNSYNPVSASEGSFPFVAFFDTDQVIAVFEVNFREYFTIADAILQLAHDWERVAVRNRDFVNSAVVDA
jgi:hypothetical protein